jgi:hypothetical protein
MVAVGLAGYAVGASRQATGIAVTVEAQPVTGSLGIRDIGEETDAADEAPSKELAIEKSASAALGSEYDYTDTSGSAGSGFYQPIKVHIDWQVNSDPYADYLDEPWTREPAAEESASAALGSEFDYTDTSGSAGSGFYQPIKVHIDWQVADPLSDPWD